MDCKFIIGDRVYHKNRKQFGTFKGIDKFSEGDCFVEFDEDEYGYKEELCVTLRQLVSDISAVENNLK